MKVIDLNVLLYAINQDAPLHAVVRPWWEGAMDGDDPIGLAWAVVLGFVRLSTSNRVFPNPLRPEVALAQVDQWLSHPNVRLVTETDEHWRILRDLLVMSGTAGNLTTDAHLAALAISYGAVLVSCDSDFGRYPHLRWHNPLR